MKKLLTLGIILKDNKVLLGLKKRGFGKGFWNGFGGKVKNGENVEECLVREFKEEVGILPLDFEKVGILTFKFENNPQLLEVHVFKISNFKGDPKETEEMKPKWFKIDEIPFDQMWPDDKLWWPLFLANKKFKAFFHFKDEKNLLNYEVKEI